MWRNLTSGHQPDWIQICTSEPGRGQFDVSQGCIVLAMLSVQDNLKHYILGVVWWIVERHRCTIVAIYTGCWLIITSLINYASSPGKHFIPPNLPNLSELIARYLPSRSLYSSNTDLLARVRQYGITSNFSSRAFSVSVPPSTWNWLSEHIRRINSQSTFKRQVKFHPFQSAFPSSHPVPAPKIRFTLSGAL